MRISLEQLRRRDLLTRQIRNGDKELERLVKVARDALGAVISESILIGRAGAELKAIGDGVWFDTVAKESLRGVSLDRLEKSIKLSGVSDLSAMSLRKSEKTLGVLDE